MLFSEFWRLAGRKKIAPFFAGKGKKDASKICTKSFQKWGIAHVVRVANVVMFYNVEYFRFGIMKSLSNNSFKCAVFRV